jgi:hypothetical protein
MSLVVAAGLGHAQSWDHVHIARAAAAPVEALS